MHSEFKGIVWLILARSQINAIQEHSFVLGFYKHVPMLFFIQFANPIDLPEAVLDFLC